VTLTPPTGSETPSRTSWGHFFVNAAAQHELVVAAEARVAALFASPDVLGPFPPLSKVEAMQGGLLVVGGSPLLSRVGLLAMHGTLARCCCLVRGGTQLAAVHGWVDNSPRPAARTSWRRRHHTSGVAPPGGSQNCMRNNQTWSCRIRSCVLYIGVSR
jgi:hypothetical protein